MTDYGGSFVKYALVGEKLGHSYSKIIHEKYFKYKNLDCTYDLIEIEKGNLKNKLDQMKNDGYIGYNVTIPYKIDVMNMCDNVLDEAYKIGSINTIKYENGKMIGYNTDYHGLKLALHAHNVEIKNKNIVILGTGGASRAVCALCEDLNCNQITFVSREIKNNLGFKCITYNDKILGDIVINTTPVGMYPETDNTPLNDFCTFQTAVDLIYNPD